MRRALVDAIARWIEVLTVDIASGNLPLIQAAQSVLTVFAAASATAGLGDTDRGAAPSADIGSRSEFDHSNLLLALKMMGQGHVEPATHAFFLLLGRFVQRDATVGQWLAHMQNFNQALLWRLGPRAGAAASTLPSIEPLLEIAQMAGRFHLRVLRELFRRAGDDRTKLGPNRTFDEWFFIARQLENSPEFSSEPSGLAAGKPYRRVSPSTLLLEDGPFDSTDGSSGLCA